MSEYTERLTCVGVFTEDNQYAVFEANSGGWPELQLSLDQFHELGSPDELTVTWKT